jgi:hypothetical protein
MLSRSHWLEDLKHEQAQEIEADARYDDDVWAEPVHKYLASRNETSVGEILLDALGKQQKDWTKVDQMRVGGIMVRAGWERRRVRIGGGARASRHSRVGERVVSPLTTPPNQ